MKTLKDLGDLKGKRVLMRADFNVPLDGTTITDDGRIKAALPTITALREEGAKVILMAHLGRPKGKVVPELSLAPVAKRLGELLGVEVPLAKDTYGEDAQAKVAAMNDGDVVLLENVRFNPEETSKDADERAAYAKKIAALGEAFVSDGFGVVHRAQGSNYDVAADLPAAAGLLVEKEVKALSKATENPERPFTVVLGGSKVSDKLGVIENLLDKANRLVIGGGMVFTFLKAKGYEVGTSLLEEDQIETVKGYMERAEKNGVELMMETRAIEVLMDSGKAAGVKARQGKTEYTINAKAVMLASGGFDGQDWAKELYAPGAVGWHTFSSPSNTGDGIELAKQAGAMTLLKGGLSQIHLVGREPLPLNDELSALRMVNTGVFVTDLGYRCANESMTSQFDYFTPFVESGRKEFTIICDSQQPDKRMELIKKGVEKGVVDTADTIEELAEAAGLPSYPLMKTIERYNELCEAGEDADFHKKPEDLQAIEKAPFYAIQITPNTNDSFGQLAISTKAEVLDADRKPVPGLYAGGTLGNAELFYMRYAVSGSSMCMGTVTGRIAAQSALEYYGA